MSEQKPLDTSHASIDAAGRVTLHPHPTKHSGAHVGRALNEFERVASELLAQPARTMNAPETFHRMARSDLQRLAERAGMLLVEADGGVLSFHEPKRPGLAARLALALVGLAAVIAGLTAAAFAGGLLAGVWALAFRAVA